MTQLNNDIKSLDPCPPEEFLRAWATGKLKDKALHSVILSHLEFCSACAQEVREFKSEGDPIAKRAQALRDRQLAQQNAVKQGPTPGTIWRTVPESEGDPFGPLVLVLDNQATNVTVAEVSENVEQAIHTDMVLQPQESRLRFRCMIRAGNVFTTGTDRLTLFAGALPESLMNQVLAFCKDPERFDENIKLSEIVFLKDTQGIEFMRRRGVTSGMLVTEENDPRLEFAKLSKQTCSYLSNKPAITDKSESKVIPLPARSRFVKTILALAAVLATVVVTWKGSQIVSDRSMERLKAESFKQVEELKKQLAAATEDKVGELTDLRRSGEALKSKIADVEGQNTRLKTDMQKMADSITNTEKALSSARERADFTTKEMAKVRVENEVLKKSNTELAASNYESRRQLAEARESLERLKPKIAVEGELRSEAETGGPTIDPKERKAVLQAVQSGDLVALRELVKNESLANFYDKQTWTHPLHLAALNGDEAVTRFLLNKGADIDARDKEGKTALMLAATKGHRDLTKLLLERRADPKLCDKDGKTALYWALENGHREIAADLRSSLGFSE